MKLKDLYEMTWRTGLAAPDYDFSNLSSLVWKRIGKMQHGYEVVSSNFNNTILYAVKINDEFASVTVTHEKTLPVIGKVLVTELSRTNEKYKSDLLSVKLKHFLINHLQVSLLLSDLHSIATENLLKKIDKYFNVKLVNIKFGGLVDWSYDNYLELTSDKNKTDWQVLLQKTNNHFNEEKINYLPGMDKDRQEWTYYNFFEDC